MKIILKAQLLILFTFCSFLSFAQNASIPKEDIMRSNGKIYVVMAVVLIIITGLFIYLFSVDKKLSKLEKQLKS